MPNHRHQSLLACKFKWHIFPHAVEWKICWKRCHTKRLSLWQ